MAKRFVDSGLFDDQWFSELSKDGKIFWVYFITKCDHAGLLRLNVKLIQFQTGINSLATVIKELGNCLITVRQDLLFCPKYLKFQYPDFPKSNVKQQEGAINLLKRVGLWDEELNTYLTVGKELPNTYVNDIVLSNIESSEKKEIELHKLQIYVRDNLKNISKVKNQLTFQECEKLLKEFPKKMIADVLESMENKLDLTKKYVSVYRTIRNWLKNSKKSIAEYVVEETKVKNEKKEVVDPNEFWGTDIDWSKYPNHPENPKNKVHA